MPATLITRHARALARTGLVVLAAAAIAAGYLAVRSANAPAAAEGRPSASIPITPSRHEAVFVGDDFSRAAQSPDPARLWTAALAAGQGWDPVNLSAAGTGFLARPSGADCAASSCPSLVDLVPRIVARAPQVVVVAAGDADLGQDPQAVQAAVRTVFEALHVGLPNARIVAVGPSSAAAPSAELLVLDAAVRSAAEREDAHYVSLLAPPVLDATMLVDKGAGLTADGQSAILARLTSSLAAG